MTNHELLSAISDMMDQKFKTELQPIKDDIHELKDDVKELRSDVTELQSDVKDLRSDVTELQSDVKELRGDVTELQTGMNELQSDMTQQKTSMTQLLEDVHGIHLYLENVVDYKISLLVENYVPAATRFEQSSSRIDAMEEDIGILKTVVAQHSKMLQQLA